MRQLYDSQSPRIYAEIYAFQEHNEEKPIPETGAFIVERDEEHVVHDFKTMYHMGGVQLVVGTLNFLTSGTVDRWKNNGYYGVLFAPDNRSEDSDIVFIAPVMYAPDERSKDYIISEIVDPFVFDVGKDTIPAR